MKYAILVAFAVSILATGKTHAQAAQGYALEELWTVNDLVFAEAVLVIPGDDYLYVSVVNGDDNVGYIARLNRDGTVDTKEWVPGIQTPTGSTFYDGHIYVANQVEILKINRDTGEIVQRIPSEFEKGLNDIAVSDDGLFIITAPLSGKLFTIKDDKVVEWLDLAPVTFPNGVHIDADSVIVGSMGKVLGPDATPDDYGAMYRIDINTKTVSMVAATEKSGNWDGVAPFADGLLGASPMSSEVWYFYEGRRSFLSKLEGGVADVGTDPEAGIMYAPFLFANKVSAYKLIPFEWTRVFSEGFFRSKVVDQLFGEDSGSSVAKSDGTLEGEFDGKKLTGNYEFKDGLFCRESRLGEIDLGEDCIVLEVTDTQLRLNLNKGMGLSVIYDRQ